MKRRSDHNLSTEDMSMKRIVRHKEHHDSPSPEPIIDRDSRKRSLAEREIHRSYSSPATNASYDKYTGGSKYNHSHGSRRSSPMDRSPSIERHHRPSHGFIDSSPIKRSNSKAHQPEGSSGSAASGHHIGLGAIYDSIEYSLHVSNLDMRPSEEELRKALFREFKRFGYISVKVVGYGKERRAFVNYQHYDQARRAKRENQSLMLFNRPIHVEWSKQTLHKYPEVATGKKPASKSTPELRSSSTTSSYYHDSFSPRSSNTTTMKDHHHHHHDHIVSDHKRDVSYRAPPSRVESNTVEAKPVIPITDPSATRTLFVGNLELDITERELRDLFSQYGRIESVDIKLAKSAGTTYAFVKFTTITDAMNAKEYLHGRQYGDFQLKIGFGKGSPSGKVWIGNLSCSRDLAEVRHEMDRFGLIRRCDYRDGDNHAYVHFENLDAAQAAVSSLNNFRLKNGRTIKLDLHKPSYFFRESDESPVEYYSSSKRERRSSDDYLSSNHHSRDSGSGSYYKSGTSNDYFSSKGRDRVVSDSSRDSDRSYRKRSHNSDSSYRQVTHSDNLNGDVARSKRRALDVDYNASNSSKNYYKSSSKDKAGNRHRRDHDRDDRSNSNHSGEKDHSDERGSGTSNKHSSETEAKNNGDPNSDDKVHNFTADANVASSIVVEKDTALKLTDSTEPISPVGDTKGSKNDHSHTESLANLAKKYPVAWRGSLVLKNTGFPARMYLIGGDPSVAEYLLKCKDDSSALRITQRLRLEQPRLDEVNKRISLAGPSGHCVLFALPGPTLNQGGNSSPDESDSAMQLRPLRSLVSYLKQKEAAGIVALNAADVGENDKDPKEVLGVLHAFPPCEFSQSQLLKIIPSLGSEPSREDHIVVLLVKGNV